MIRYTDHQQFPLPEPSPDPHDEHRAAEALNALLSFAVIHRVCAWCGANLGDVACSRSDPQAFKTTHGICPACAEGMKATP